jgi:hypothetical protein
MAVLVWEDAVTLMRLGRAHLSTRSAVNDWLFDALVSDVDNADHLHLPAFQVSNIRHNQHL